MLNIQKSFQRVGLGRRHFSIVNELKGEINTWVDKATPQFMGLKKQGDKVIGEVTVGMAMGGMRGIPGMLTETSYLDAHKGIEYRGYDLNECNAKLPKHPGSEVGLPEAAFWLLLTGNIPTAEQTKQLTAELHKRADLPAHVIQTIDALPKDMHAMTKLSIGILALQSESSFYKTYSSGKYDKATLWEHTLEDSVTLMAKIAPLAARIFRNHYFNGEHIGSDTSLDWAANYAAMLGVSKDPDFLEMTRLYLMLHADHEGGNVSAHTTHLVGSALSDPFLSYSAGVNGLAGPLHGLANQECLRWLRNTKKELGAGDPTVESVTQFAKDTLASGRVVPGFGHGVLRVTDPRYAIQHAFAAKKFPDDPLFKLANVCYEAIPPVLEATGKVKNPWPNVDALSGTCMQYYGLTQEDYYTVVFAVSRSIGCLAQLTLSRRMGLPIERVKSVDMKWLDNKLKNKHPVCSTPHQLRQRDFDPREEISRPVMPSPNMPAPRDTMPQHAPPPMPKEDYSSSATPRSSAPPEPTKRSLDTPQSHHSPVVPIFTDGNLMGGGPFDLTASMEHHVHGTESLQSGSYGEHDSTVDASPAALKCPDDRDPHEAHEGTIDQTQIDDPEAYWTSIATQQIASHRKRQATIHQAREDQALVNAALAAIQDIEVVRDAHSALPFPVIPHEFEDDLSVDPSAEESGTAAAPIGFRGSSHYDFPGVSERQMSEFHQQPRPDPAQRQQSAPKTAAQQLAQAQAESTVPGAPNSWRNVSLGNLLASEFASPSGVLEMFTMRRKAECVNDQFICVRIQNCNPSKALGPNFQRVAMAYGCAMYRSMFCVCRVMQVANMSKFFHLLDSSAASLSRRPRLVFLSQSMLCQKLGDAAERLFHMANAAAQDALIPRYIRCHNVVPQRQNRQNNNWRNNNGNQNHQHRQNNHQYNNYQNNHRQQNHGNNNYHQGGGGFGGSSGGGHPNNNYHRQQNNNYYQNNSNSRGGVPYNPVYDEGYERVPAYQAGSRGGSRPGNRNPMHFRTNNRGEEQGFYKPPTAARPAYQAPNPAERAMPPHLEMPPRMQQLHQGANIGY